MATACKFGTNAVLHAKIAVPGQRAVPACLRGETGRHKGRRRHVNHEDTKTRREEAEKRRSCLAIKIMPKQPGHRPAVGAGVSPAGLNASSLLSAGRGRPAPRYLLSGCRASIRSQVAFGKAGVLKGVTSLGATPCAPSAANRQEIAKAKLRKQLRSQVQLGNEENEGKQLRFQVQLGNEEKKASRRFSSCLRAFVVKPEDTRGEEDM
jgi:hypothetical protein